MSDSEAAPNKFLAVGTAVPATPSGPVGGWQATEELIAELVKKVEALEKRIVNLERRS